MSGELTREVTPKFADPWHDAYRCRIDTARPTLFLRRPRWVVVLESHWVHWREHATSAKFTSLEAAEVHAHWWLDSHENGELVYYVPIPPTPSDPQEPTP